MHTLRELQAGIAATILDADTDGVDTAIVADPPGGRARLQIYRNHYTTTLAEALAATFPVTRRLVGEHFFATAAHSFVLETPPLGPCLFEYGGEFPAFLAALPAAASLVYLRDVGRLEWAINVAYHAPDGPTLGAPAFERVPVQRYLDVGLGFHPSCRLIASAFPIDRIWQVNQRADEDIEPVDLGRGGVRLLVYRQGDDVGWQRFSRAEFAFLRTLALGGGLGEARTTAIALGGDIDIAGLFTACLEGGVFSTLSLSS